MNANHFIIKHASQEDIPALTAVERECFPAAEAASEEEIAARVHAYGKHFWLLFEGKKLIAFVDGMTTDQADLTDDMYEDASLHDENGAWQMIFGEYDPFLSQTGTRRSSDPPGNRRCQNPET